MAKYHKVDMSKINKGEIYLITNKVNWKVYVGQTVCIRKRTQGENEWLKTWGTKNRFKEHVRDAFTKPDNRRETYLYRAIRKYKPENFRYDVLITCNKEELNKYEEDMVKEFMSDQKEMGYNITPGGNANPMVQDTREKIRKRMQDLWKDPEYREKQMKSYKKRDEVNKTKGDERIGKNKGLPENIKLHRDCGYEVCLIRDNKKYRRMFASKENTLEQNLQNAINYLNELKASLRKPANS